MNNIVGKRHDLDHIISSFCANSSVQELSTHVKVDTIFGINRIQGTVLYIGPLRLQASLRARDLARYRELVGVGHRFGNVSVLAIMPSQIYPEKLEWTSNADRLKFEGRCIGPNISFIG